MGTTLQNYETTKYICIKIISRNYLAQTNITVLMQMSNTNVVVPVNSCDVLKPNNRAKQLFNRYSTNCKINNTLQSNSGSLPFFLICVIVQLVWAHT